LVKAPFKEAFEAELGRGIEAGLVAPAVPVLIVLIVFAGVPLEDELDPEGTGPIVPPVGFSFGRTLLLVDAAAFENAANDMSDYINPISKEKYSRIKSENHPSLTMSRNRTIKESGIRIVECDHKVGRRAHSGKGSSR
jgi:hypothetical protein